MPSTNTITTYNTFVASTLIRSSQVNSNFDNHRGHLLPINTDTATSSDDTHNLGSSDHRWHNNYSNIAVMTGQSTPASNPTAGAYKLYMKSDGSLYKLNSAGVEAAAGGSGGGGGAVLEWYEGANSPTLSTINNQQVYSFVAAEAQELYSEFVVPTSYVTGTQIFYKAKIYSADTSNTFLIQTVSTLLRTDTDLVSSTTNTRTSTNAAITASGTNQNKQQQISCDLTDATGNINGVAVVAGSTILVKITRGTDTATGNVAFLPKQGEVKTT